MKINIFVLLSSFIISSHAFEPEFECSDLDGIVSMMENGVDYVVEEFADDPEYFIEYTIYDWKCSTEPFPPQRRGRNFLEAVQCFTSDDNKRVSSEMLAEAGKIFQEKLDVVYSCFEDEVVSEQAKSYKRSTKGEGLLFALDRYIGDHFLILEFGYFQDSAHRTPIVWEVSVRIGSERID